MKQDKEFIKYKWDNIVNNLHYKQYFRWHHTFWSGDLKYRNMAETLKKSTKSVKIHSMCDELINELNKRGL